MNIFIPIIILLVLVVLIYLGIMFFRNQLNVRMNFHVQYKLLIFYGGFLVVAMFAYMLFVMSDNVDEVNPAVEKIKSYSNNIETLGVTQEIPEEFLKEQWETEISNESYSIEMSIHSYDDWLPGLFIIVEETTDLKEKSEVSLYQLPTALTSPFIAELGYLKMTTMFEVSQSGIVIESLDQRNDINFEVIGKPFVLNQINPNHVNDDYWGSTMIGGQQILYIKVPENTAIEVDEFLEYEVTFK